MKLQGTWLGVYWCACCLFEKSDCSIQTTQYKLWGQ